MNVLTEYLRMKKYFLSKCAILTDIVWMDSIYYFKDFCKIILLLVIIFLSLPTNCKIRELIGRC